MDISELLSSDKPKFVEEGVFSASKETIVTKETVKDMGSLKNDSNEAIPKDPSKEENWKNDNNELFQKNPSEPVNAKVSSCKAKQDENLKRKQEDVDDVVAKHYNSMPAGDLSKRQHSDIFFIRNFNNWIKAVLIDLVVKPGDKILDLGCGKGGDIGKWKKQKISWLTGIDIADISLKEAARRHSYLVKPKFEAEFILANPYKDLIDEILERVSIFDVVSSQFSFHYCFSSENGVQTTIRNISRHLKIGGHFIATIPDPEEIKSRAKHNGLKFGNELYFIEFENDLFKPFGTKYKFTLSDAVDECPEYLIDVPSLLQIAKENGLELKFQMSFPSFYCKYSEYDDYKQLLNSMKVKSSFSTSEKQVIGKIPTQNRTLFSILLGKNQVVKQIPISI